MKFLGPFRRFLNEEKVYAWMLFGILVIYTVVTLLTGTRQEEVPDSPMMAKIKQAEQTMKGKHTEREYLEQALREDPKATLILFLFVLAFIAGMGVGVAVDIQFILHSFQKRQLIPRARPMDPVDWGLRDVAKVMILFVAFGFLNSFMLGFLRGIVFKRWDDNFMILLHTTLNDVVVLLMIFYVVLKKYGRKMEDIGLGLKSWAKDVLVGLMGYLAILPVFVSLIMILLAVAALLHYEPPPHPLVEVFVEEARQHPFLIGYSLFLACVIGPVIEEIFFRGFCYPAIKKSWGARVGMIATAAFFALIHHSSFAFWPIFILGLVLAYLYEKRGSLISSISLHIIHNSLFIGYFFIMKKIFLDKYIY